tara:strand:- start:5445 stop:9131 length:3687 start_codon:yes stop_codon:yes gene_type:complete
MDTPGNEVHPIAWLWAVLTAIHRHTSENFNLYNFASDLEIRLSHYAFDMANLPKILDVCIQFSAVNPELINEEVYEITGGLTVPNKDINMEEITMIPMTLQKDSFYNNIAGKKSVVVSNKNSITSDHIMLLMYRNTSFRFAFLPLPDKVVSRYLGAMYYINIPVLPTRSDYMDYKSYLRYFATFFMLDTAVLVVTGDGNNRIYRLGDSWDIYEKSKANSYLLGRRKEWPSAYYVTAEMSPNLQHYLNVTCEIPYEFSPYINLRTVKANIKVEYRYYMVNDLFGPMMDLTLFSMTSNIMFNVVMKTTNKKDIVMDYRVPGMSPNTSFKMVAEYNRRYMVFRTLPTDPYDKNLILRYLFFIHMIPPIKAPSGIVKYAQTNTGRASRQQVGVGKSINLEGQYTKALSIDGPLTDVHPFGPEIYNTSLYVKGNSRTLGPTIGTERHATVQAVLYEERELIIPQTRPTFDVAMERTTTHVWDEYLRHSFYFLNLPQNRVTLRYYRYKDYYVKMKLSYGAFNSLAEAENALASFMPYVMYNNNLATMQTVNEHLAFSSEYIDHSVVITDEEFEEWKTELKKSMMPAEFIEDELRMISLLKMTKTGKPSKPEHLPVIFIDQLTGVLDYVSPHSKIKTVYKKVSTGMALSLSDYNDNRIGTRKFDRLPLSGKYAETLLGLAVKMRLLVPYKRLGDDNATLISCLANIAQYVSGDSRYHTLYHAAYMVSKTKDLDNMITNPPEEFVELEKYLFDVVDMENELERTWTYGWDVRPKTPYKFISPLMPLFQNAVNLPIRMAKSSVITQMNGVDVQYDVMLIKIPTKGYMYRIDKSVEMQQWFLFNNNGRTWRTSPGVLVFTKILSYHQPIGTIRVINQPKHTPKKEVVQVTAHKEDDIYNRLHDTDKRKSTKKEIVVHEYPMLIKIAKEKLVGRKRLAKKLLELEKKDDDYYWFRFTPYMRDKTDSYVREFIQDYFKTHRPIKFKEPERYTYMIVVNSEGLPIMVYRSENITVDGIVQASKPMLYLKHSKNYRYPHSSKRGRWIYMNWRHAIRVGLFEDDNDGFYHTIKRKLTSDDIRTQYDTNRVVFWLHVSEAYHDVGGPLTMVSAFNDYYTECARLQISDVVEKECTSVDFNVFDEKGIMSTDQIFYERAGFEFSDKPFKAANKTYFSLSHPRTLWRSMFNNNEELAVDYVVVILKMWFKKNLDIELTYDECEKMIIPLVVEWMPKEEESVNMFSM